MKVRKAKVIMWDVLSADFDNRITKERSLQFVILRALPGSIVVFHDSEKAFDRLRGALPEVLKHFGGLGYRMEGIDSKEVGIGILRKDVE